MGWLVAFHMEMIVKNAEWLMKAEEAASRGREGGYVSNKFDRKLYKLRVLKAGMGGGLGVGMKRREGLGE